MESLNYASCNDNKEEGMMVNLTLCSNLQDIRGEGITEVPRVTPFLDLVATEWIIVSSTSDDTTQKEEHTEGWFKK